MYMEIERKFLVRTVPNTAGLKSGHYRQGYLSVGSDGEVRLRDADGGLTLTVKAGEGMVRRETEVNLSVEQFESLWPATEGRRVEKRRAFVPIGELVAEVDVYEGALSGLTVVEVEFESLDEARAFAPPEWFGHEVTDDPAYKNASLALGGRPPA
jgi:adenylate cyclase